MPLIVGKSPASFGKNVSTEMHAGKPQKQSLAIAYAMKRKAQKEHKAHGGFVEEEKASGYANCPHCMAKGGMCEKHMAAGGFVEEEKASGWDEFDHPGKKMNMAAEHESEHEDMMHHEEDEDEDLDMVDRIMRQRMSHGGMMRKGYSEGGRVANRTMDEEDEFEPNEFDDMVKDNHLDPEYHDNEEIGDEQEDEDRHDIISRIMRSRRLKAGHYPKTGQPGYPE